MNLDDFSYEYDGRRYVDPNVLLADQNAFIDNYRNLQAQNNAQIAQQTRALGTQVPSQLGGLTGGGSYFKSRYQTPQTNQAVAELRTAAQAQALQQALQNELEKAKKKYKDAQNKATAGGGGGSNDFNFEVDRKRVGGDPLDTVKTGEDEISLNTKSIPPSSGLAGAAEGALIGGAINTISPGNLLAGGITNPATAMGIYDIFAAINGWPTSGDLINQYFSR